MSKPSFVLFRASVVWPAVIIAIIAVELVLGWRVYHSYDVATALAALAGVPVLAVIDWLARARSNPQTAWYRRYLAWWCLVPFAAALAGSFWVHYDKWIEGLDDIWQVAIDFKRELPEASGKNWGYPDGAGDPTTDPAAAPASGTPAPIPAADRVLSVIGWPYCRVDDKTITSSDINTAVSRMFAQRYAVGTENAAIATLQGESSQVSEQARRFTELARVVGRDLRLACGRADIVHERVKADTLLDFGLALAVQALFVMWIPVLLAITIGRAYSRGRRVGPRGVSESLHSRDNRILAEDRYLFVPRFCFGALLVLGTNYVFSPFGLKATYIMAIVDEHALPGHPTWVLWSTSFAAVPVLVVGFVGFLLYALVTASQRFALDDLDDSTVLSLLVRGLVVILLCFALSSSPMNETVSRIFVFVAGVFPLRALEALAKKVNIAIDPDFDGAVSSFDGLPSLDPSKVFALRSAGIQSTYDLAATPIEEIAERVRIDPRLLGRAVDRAILIDALGLELTRRLEPFAITSATELVALKDNIPPLVELTPPDLGVVTAAAPLPAPGIPPGPPPANQLHDAAALVAGRLACDPRVVQVRTWLAGTPYFDGLHLDRETEAVLKAAGFVTTEQLIASPIEDVAWRARVDPCSLGQVIDSALLIDAVGSSHARQLAPHGVHSANDLMEHKDDAAVEQVLGDELPQVIDRLSKDKRVTEVRRWLSCALPAARTPAPPPRLQSRPPTAPILPGQPIPTAGSPAQPPAMGTAPIPTAPATSAAPDPAPPAPPTSSSGSR